MSFLPDWWSQGVQGMDNNGGFGTAGMFNKPGAGQTGDFGGYLPKLISALRNYKSGMSDSTTPDMTGQADNAPNTNSMPNFTPYQGDSMAPQMGKINSPLQMSPNGQIMPNWNRNYGGY